MSNLDNLRNEISETKFGQFYYQAKSHYIEYATIKVMSKQGIIKKESPKWLAVDEFLDLGTLSHFIEWFEEHYKDRAVPPFDVLIRTIKELCTKDDEIDYSACFKIIWPMLSFPDLLRSEGQRKSLYSEVGEREKKKRKREIDKYKKNIKGIQEYNPKFDPTRQLILPKHLPLSRTYAQIKMMRKSGIIFRQPNTWKSTRFQMVRTFINALYSISKEHSNLKDNAICTRIATILDLLKTDSVTGTRYNRKSVSHYLEHKSTT